MPVTEIPTDLLTPLGAYLSLREGARCAFLLESVERGRLGRYSFVGAGSQLVSFAEAETLGEPVVGYLGYDAVASFEPTVPLPEDGPGVPESRFLVPDVLLRFNHARGVAELLRGDAPGLTEPPPLPRGSAPRTWSASGPAPPGSWSSCSTPPCGCRCTPIRRASSRRATSATASAIPRPGS